MRRLTLSWPRNKSGGTLELRAQNNFDFLRIFAAALVLFSHCFPLFGKSPEPFSWAMGYEEGGGLAVQIFFVISGFLVSASLIRRGNIAEYLQARALRILPGLLVVVLFGTFVIGPLFTTLSLNAYFNSSGAWGYLRNALIFPIQFPVPGTFADHSHTSVNGSLWTLPIEVFMYLLLIPMFWSGWLSNRIVALAFPIAFFCAFAIGETFFGLGWDNRGPIFLWSVDLFNVFRLGIFFFAGVAIYAYRDVIKADWRLASLLLALFICTFHSKYGFAGAVIAIPYLTYYIAYCGLPLWRITSVTGDISYGFYIYAFPVQQSVFELGRNSLSFWAMMGISAIVTTALAYLSWTLIEKPVLSLKGHLWPGHAFFPATADSSRRLGQLAATAAPP
jgi:peptidoglycan/LPS O-acetylase OafA/YrhL